MVDSKQLAGEADFPEVNLNKFGWQQFLSLDNDEVEERCWRADIVISTNTPITAEVIDKAFKLKLIIAAGDSTEHIDQAAANARNITVLNIPGVIGNSPENTQIICQQVIDNINNWLENTKA